MLSLYLFKSIHASLTVSKQQQQKNEKKINKWNSSQIQILPLRFFFFQGPNGPAGPIGPPGPRGYPGPKVS